MERLQRRDPYYAGTDASLAVLNTNLACASRFLSWIALDYATGHKRAFISSVNGHDHRTRL